VPRTPILLFALVLLPSGARAEPRARFADVPGSEAATPATPRVAPHHESWARSSARERVRRALELSQRGDAARALVELTEALRADPSFGEAYLALGSLRERMGDVREAERVYDRAVRLPDVSAEALAGRSRARRAAGREEEAFRDLEASVALRPTPGTLRALADWYVAKKAWPAALVAWRRVLSLVEGRDGAARDEARLRVRALTLLAAESDPVSSGNDGGWVRSALAHMAVRTQ